MPLPKGYSKSAKAAQSKDRALEDVRHYCLGQEGTKKRTYFWDCDDTDNEAIDAFFALVDAVPNYYKEIKIYFLRAKKGLHKWATREVWQDEIYDNKLSSALLKARLLRYKITQGPGKCRDKRIVDIEQIAEASEEPQETPIVTYKFQDELTSDDM